MLISDTEGAFVEVQIYPIMATCTAAIWALVDRSKAGVVLGLLLAVGAPLGEAVIANGLHWWHYSRPDTPFLNVCYWTGGIALQHPLLMMKSA